ncbi:hypothetical protein [Paenibacillus sp. RC82]
MTAWLRRQYACKVNHKRVYNPGYAERNASLNLSVKGIRRRIR